MGPFCLTNQRAAWSCWPISNFIWISPLSVWPTSNFYLNFTMLCNRGRYIREEIYGFVSMTRTVDLSHVSMTLDLTGCLFICLSDCWWVSLSVDQSVSHLLICLWLDLLIFLAGRAHLCLSQDDFSKALTYSSFNWNRSTVLVLKYFW